MKKKIICLLIIMVTIIFSINVFQNKVYAADTLDDVFSGAQDFLEQGTDSTIDETELKDTSNFIYNVLLAIAIVVAVIIGMVIGIQFMTASAEEKAKIKELLMPYVLGCFVVFGAFGIWRLAVTVLSSW